MAIHESSHLIAVIGGKGGVGKSVFAANLAHAFVREMRAKVLLIDCDPKSCGDQNFITGIRHLMADQGLDTVKAAATFLGVKYMSLHKIMDGTNSPTVAQCITLCEKAGYSANWLLLNMGSRELIEPVPWDDAATAC